MIHRRVNDFSLWLFTYDLDGNLIKKSHKAKGIAYATLAEPKIKDVVVPNSPVKEMKKYKF